MLNTESVNQCENLKLLEKTVIDINEPVQHIEPIITKVGKLEHSAAPEHERFRIEPGKAFANTVLLDKVKAQKSDILEMAYYGKLDQIASIIKNELSPGFSVQENISQMLYKHNFYDVLELYSCGFPIYCRTSLIIQVDGRSNDLYSLLNKISKTIYIHKMSCKQNKICFHYPLTTFGNIKNLKDFKDDISFCNAVYEELSDLKKTKYIFQVKINR